MADRQTILLRMRSVILLSLMTCTSVVLVLSGVVFVRGESARQAVMHRSLLDSSARRIALSVDQFLSLHSAALTLVAESLNRGDCTSPLCHAQKIADLQRCFPAFQAVSENDAAATGKLYFVALPLPGAATDTLPVQVSVARTSADDQSRGSLVGILRVPLPHLFSVSSDNPERTGGNLLLIDRAGAVLFSSAGTSISTLPAPAALLAAIRDGTGEVQLNDQALLIQTGAVAAADWRVVVMVPRERSVPGLTTLVSHAGLALLIALLIAVPASLWISRVVLRMLDGLAHTMRRPDPNRLDEPPIGEGLARPSRGEADESAAATQPICDQTVTEVDMQHLAHAGPDGAHRELAARARQREAEVDEQTADLKNALNFANEAIRARDTLLANTSHEIRTPLYGIIGGIELLRPNLTDAEDLNNLNAIMQSAESLTQLINDLLDFSRINAGALQLAPQPFSVSELAREVVASVQPLSAKRGIGIRLTDELTTGIRRGDALRVRQILFNLLGNAVKFTEKGEVRLSLQDDGTGIRIVIADTGVGIAIEDLQRIFKPFEQADLSMRRRFQGTGLGLAIVDGLVSAMGGSIAIASQLGKGTTFTLSLPLPPSAALNRDDDQAPAPMGSFAGLRVLVVDDVEINRTLLSAQLKRLGAEAICAEDGYAALTLLSRETVDLVLLDLQMPGIDGLETAGRMRALPNGRCVRIVAVTANVQPGERENCLAASMDDYATKPLRMAGLRQLLADTMAYAGRDLRGQAEI